MLTVAAHMRLVTKVFGFNPCTVIVGLTPRIIFQFTNRDQLIILLYLIKDIVGDSVRLAVDQQFIR